MLFIKETKSESSSVFGSLLKARHAQFYLGAPAVFITAQVRTNMMLHASL